MDAYLLGKTLHLCAFVLWFSGVLSLPRVLALAARDAHDRARLLALGGAMLRVATVFGLVTLASGAWLWSVQGATGGWLHAKLTLVFLLIALQFFQGRACKRLSQGASLRSPSWTLAATPLLLVLIVGLAVMKPF